MNITRAKYSERHQIYELILENAVWIESLGIVQWPIDWLQREKKKIFQSVADNFFYTYYVDSVLVGCVELRTEPEELWSYNDEKSMYIHKLAVNRSFKGVGLGRSMVEAIAIMAREEAMKFVRLDCVAKNTKLRAYYESQGFKFVQVVECPEVDLALFERSLEESREKAGVVRF